MDLKDLNKIDIKDLKNINWGRARERLQSRPGIVIGILMVAVTLLVVYGSYQKYMHVKQSLTTELTVLREKSQVLKKYETAQRLFNDFVTNIPGTISGERLIETISEIASKRDVQILSFSPAKKKNSAYVTLTNVKINITSDSYDNIILFTNDIENSPYAIRIGGWSGTSVARESPQYQDIPRGRVNVPDDVIKEVYIEATVEIESVEFKNV